MKCTKCNKDFDSALEVFIGKSGTLKLCCPKCFEELSGEFVVTEHNEEMFRLSELSYHTYLQNCSVDDMATAAEVRLYLENAIKYCKLAVYEGHPEAQLKLGYYYEKNYIGYGSSGFDGFRVARYYYKRILSSESNIRTAYQRYVDKINKTDGEVNNNVRFDDNWVGAKTQHIITEAKAFLKDMLTYLPLELMKEFAHDLREYLPEGYRENNVSTNNKLDQICAVLDKCEGGYRRVNTPCFGHFVVTVTELRNFITKQNSAKESSFDKYKKFVNFSYCKIIVPTADKIQSTNILPTETIGKDKPVPVKDSAALKRIIDSDAATTKYCLIFFNEKCESDFLSKKKLDHLRNVFKGNGDELKNWISKSRVVLTDPLDNVDKRVYTGHVFYAGDVCYAMSKQAQQKHGSGWKGVLSAMIACDDE